MEEFTLTHLSTAATHPKSGGPAGDDGPARHESGPAVTHVTLDNGLELVVIPDHRAPVVTHMVWYLSLIHI